MGQIAIEFDELETEIGKDKLSQIAEKEIADKGEEGKSLVQLIVAALEMIATDVETVMYNDGNDVKTKKDSNGKQEEGYSGTLFTLNTNLKKEEVINYLKEVISKRLAE